MLIAIISDIHGNLPALEEVIKRIDELKADVVYCLGDTVGYGPFPNECVQIVQKRCKVTLKGNHDSGLTGETPLDDFNSYGLSAIQWTGTVITKPNLAFLKALPFTSKRDDLVLAHASPQNPESWTYVLTMRAARENFGVFKARLCFIGHTHVPVVIGEAGTVNQYTTGDRFIINVGSVGQPRDGNPQAAFGFYDSVTKEYRLERVPYDIQRTARAIREHGLPEFLAQRLFQGT
jgi:putative phosphoesterase